MRRKIDSGKVLKEYIVFNEESIEKGETSL